MGQKSMGNSQDLRIYTIAKLTLFQNIGKTTLQVPRSVMNKYAYLHFFNNTNIYTLNIYFVIMVNWDILT